MTAAAASSLDPRQVPAAAEAVRRAALDAALPGALERGEFALLYQPIVELHQGSVEGLAALPRWHCPQLGVIAPAEFVPAAERIGAMAAIGDWIVRAACLQAVACRAAGAGTWRIHVPVTAAQLTRGDLADRIQALLVQTRADPAQLGVDVGEGLPAGGGHAAAHAMRALRHIGVEVALDGLATGRSCLDVLRSLPIDVIKIEGAWLQEETASATDIAMTRAIVTTAHSLQIRVRAVGVDSEAQLAQLLAHRCDAMQGARLGAPLDAAGLGALVAAPPRLPIPSSGQPPRQRTLLLVDDEPHVLASLKRCLRRGGYRILTAGSAAEGLQRLAETEVDVIVSDQRMPGMTGVEFLRRAKHLHPRTVRMVLSGYTELNSITEAINEGAIYKFLTKPWEDDLLAANISEAFRQKELADENHRLDAEIRVANAELAELNERLHAAVDRQQQEIDLAADRSRNALDILFVVPVALVGFDADGLVAFANLDAERQLPGIGACIGSDAVLPPWLAALQALRDEEEIVVALPDRQWRCRSRAIDDSRGRRGRLVSVVPLHDPVAHSCCATSGPGEAQGDAHA